ncbi:MAG: TonB-dependent receptor [Gemmatimonadetes bacterium]|nr:TonB-dependent receptor [Gemmatimonadota bacterium]
MSAWTFAHRTAADRQRSAHGRLPVGAALALLGLLAGAWSNVAAQETGTVSGRVSAARTGAPISSVQVYLVGTGIGTLTAENGRFIIVNVPAGTHEVRAERIGYQAVTQGVTVQGGGSHAVTFDLEEEVLGLDEIVVTGEAGAARRREIGNTITQLNLAEIPEPARGLESLLQARGTSLTITESAGSVGAGAMIRLRGVHSVAMSNQPLVYVDGVRIRSDPYPKNYPPADITNRSVNIQASPLNDIDPNSIERIEVIKGAAATALYGTEASAGVIQIFTKKGTPGRARWQLQIDQGYSHPMPVGPDNEPYMRLDPWLRGLPSFLAGGIKDKAEGRFAGGFCSAGATPEQCRYEYGTAYRQKYYVSARGGGASDLTYFLAGSWENNKGIFVNDAEEKFNVQGNFGFSPMQNLQLQWNTSLTSNDISNTPSGNNSHGIILNTYRGDINYVGGFKYDLINRVLEYEINTNIDHLITGVTATYSPSTRFNTRLTVGWDRALVELRQLRRFGYRLAPTGILGNKKWVGEKLTFDYAGSYVFDVSERFGLTASWGGQAVEDEETDVAGDSRDFPGPGEPTLSSGGKTLSFEERIRVINAGFFGQMRLDWRDRVFLTAGLRVDGNSAFGENLGLEPYPKVSFSWVVSDEPFWKPSLGSLKLRAAMGESGRAPGAFDAVRTWDPTRLGTTPGFLPRNAGNPELGPERTREYEAGFDASVLDNRVSGEFTYYYQRTADALFRVRRTPSLGGWDAQLENVGEMENKGIELNVNATVLQRENLTWDVGVSYATNRSKVLDLGGAAPFSVGGNAWIIEGEPVPVVLGRKILNPDELADPRYETCLAPGTGAKTTECVMGPNQPTTTIVPNTRIRLPGDIILSARGEFMGGFYMGNSGWSNAISRAADWPTCRDLPQRILKGDVADIPAKFRALCNFRTTTLRGTHVFKADFFKIRDITAQFPLGRLVPWGESPTLTLSARNWIRWYNDDWLDLDPEMVDNSGHNTVYRVVGEAVAPPAVFTMSLRVGF